MNILLTYDVDTTTCDGARRLRKVAKACVNYGQRVQNSVFECELSEAQLCLLRDCLRAIIDCSKDSVRIYALHKDYSKRVEVIGVETSYNVNEAIII